QQGAVLTICDINAENVKRCINECSAKVSTPENIHKVDCDVFAPCALSNPINTQNINEISAPIIAGSANNQLENIELAIRLKE
ncbi:MAG TPA: hypothetical protein PLD88_08345, partial [Candidatus Berkiella sp.]|nr:hypothetical protein [Candidatus Berkiella sp.]